MPPTTFVLLSLFVAGCGSREGDTDPEGLPDDTDDGSCTSDDACDADSICEADACVYGYRDNEATAATPLFWSDLVEGGIDSVASVYTEGGQRVVWEDGHPALDTGAVGGEGYFYLLGLFATSSPL